MDIETTPAEVYAWGLFDQTINICQIIKPSYVLCWAAKWHGKKKIFFEAPDISKTGKVTNYKRMLKAKWELLDEADVVVHYNGKRFDIPHLNREFLLHKMPPPSPFHQVDLLKVVKKNFKFISNKLEYVTRSLGHKGKVPHEGFSLWKKCMHGDKEAWRTMKKYNIGDITELESVYNDLLPWIDNHPNHALYTDDTRPSCPNCNGIHIIKKGIETTRSGKYQRFRCSDCLTNIRGENIQFSKDKKKSIMKQSKL